MSLLLGLLSLLGGCGGHVNSGQVVLRVGDQMHGLETLLKAAGEDKPGDGYTIEWSNFVGGPAVIAAQTGGSVDVAGCTKRRWSSPKRPEARSK
jgi:sulfonate transport system substrate-binding protein